MFVKLISLIIGIFLPIGFLAVALITRKYLKPLLLGMLCFFVTQILLRLPLLQLLSRSSDFLFFEGTQPLFFGILLALSAGLFEETGRFVFMKLGLPKKNSWTTGVWFGLGHGGIEALLVYGLPVLMVPAAQASGNLLVGGIERIFAVLLHVGMSLLVLYGMQKNQKRYYFLALLVHTFVDALVTIIPLCFGNNILLIEAALILISMVLFFYTLTLKRKWGFH